MATNLERLQELCDQQDRVLPMVIQPGDFVILGDWGSADNPAMLRRVVDVGVATGDRLAMCSDRSREFELIQHDMANRLTDPSGSCCTDEDRVVILTEPRGIYNHRPDQRVTRVYAVDPRWRRRARRRAYSRSQNQE